jgi:hypothetical protein
MTQAWLAAALTGAWLLAGAGAAQSAPPDLSLPGAEARLGWGGGYSSGAWSLLRLRATGGEAYRLRLETETGTLRRGLIPLSATLEVAPGAGVREAQVWVPLFTKRPVRLTLSGSTGERRLSLTPLSALETVTATFTEPGAYLGRVRVDAASDATAALSAVAGGAQLRSTDWAALLPNGALGLGEVRAEEAFDASPVDLERIASALAPIAAPPERRSSALAWWSAGVFVVVLGVYSARRLEPRVTAFAAAGALIVGGVGFAALQAVDAPEAARTVLVGAGGWGVRLNLYSRFNTVARDLELPGGAGVLAPLPTEHRLETTRVRAFAWSQVSYWTMPVAARVPLRVDARGLENTEPAALEDVYVVGRGIQERLGRARRAFPALGSTPPWSGGSAEHEALAALLPLGSAIARRGATLVIGLPSGERP